MSAGIKGEMTLDVTGEIQSWTVIGDQDGQIQFDIKKVDFANFPNFLFYLWYRETTTR